MDVNDNDNKMNILIGLNDGFLLPVKVMLRSLIDNNPVPLHIFVLYSDLKDFSITELKALQKDVVKMEFVKIDESIFENAEVHSQYSKEAYFRLLAYTVIDASIDRILWLDGDLIIKASLLDFYSQDFDGNLFAAVKDMNIELALMRKKELHIPDEYEYVNSGVLLLNLKKMRETMTDASLILNYIKNNHSILLLVDQDVINALFFDSVKVCHDYRYNFLVKNILLKNLYQGIRLNGNYILHYSGSVKPWEKHYHFLGFGQFWKYGLKFPEYKKLYRSIRYFRRAEWFKRKALTCIKRAFESFEETE